MAPDSVLVCTKCFQFTTAKNTKSVVPQSKCAMCGDVKTGYEVARSEVPFTHTEGAPLSERRQPARGIDS